MLEWILAFEHGGHHMRAFSTTGLIMSLCVVSLAHGAEVYRSIDSAGNVVYSDRPDHPGAVPVVIRTAAAVAPAARPQSAPARQANAAPATEPDAATIARAEAAQQAEDRAANCEAARTRSERYDTAHRLYRAGENGEREYLTDAQIDEARATAQAEVARWCS